jgi:hypothetical protein
MVGDDDGGLAIFVDGEDAFGPWLVAAFAGDCRDGGRGFVVERGEAGVLAVSCFDLVGVPFVVSALDVPFVSCLALVGLLFFSSPNLARPLALVTALPAPPIFSGSAAFLPPSSILAFSSKSFSSSTPSSPPPTVGRLICPSTLGDGLTL